MPRYALGLRVKQHTLVTTHGFRGSASACTRSSARDPGRSAPSRASTHDASGGVTARRTVSGRLTPVLKDRSTRRTKQVRCPPGLPMSTGRATRSIWPFARRESGRGPEYSAGDRVIPQNTMTVARSVSSPRTTQCKKRPTQRMLATSRVFNRRYVNCPLCATFLRSSISVLGGIRLILVVLKNPASTSTWTSAGIASTFIDHVRERLDVSGVCVPFDRHPR